jgi:hypothetical protein
MIKADEELDQLEEMIRKLKNKYDQFFAGIAKVPPTEDRRRVEAIIHERSKDSIRDNARRFRFNTVISRYNQFREMWARRMREREEGPMDFKRRSAALAAPIEPPPPPPPQAPRVTSGKPEPYVRIAAASNGEEIQRLYDRIRDEHLKQGKLPTVTLEQVGTMVRKQAEIVRTKFSVDTVAFRVETIDGKVKLKAKPIQE